VTKRRKKIKMKTNKQQLVILMLLVIPSTLMIVTTTTTTQQAFAKSGSNKGQTDASRDTQGLNDNGVPTYDPSCPKHSDCTQYQSDYNAEWNSQHPKSSTITQQDAQAQGNHQGCIALICRQDSGQAQASGQSTSP
jgi:hypothetical protein